MHYHSISPTRYLFFQWKDHQSMQLAILPTNVKTDGCDVAASACLIFHERLKTGIDELLDIVSEVTASAAFSHLLRIVHRTPTHAHCSARKGQTIDIRLTVFFCRSCRSPSMIPGFMSMYSPTAVCAHTRASAPPILPVLIL